MMKTAQVCLVRLAREILPGVTTLLEVDLPPQLPSRIESEAASRLARITFSRSGQAICTNGLVTEQGLVVTANSALAGTNRADVETSEGLFRSVEVIHRDPDGDLAFLNLGTDAPEDIPATGSASNGQYAWSISYADCKGNGGERNVERTRLGGPYSSRQGATTLFPTVRSQAAGALGAFLLGGGGGGDPQPQAKTTGEIRITIPGGTP